MDDLAQAVKALTEELKTFREALTLELTDGTRVTAFEYLADQVKYLSEIVETHTITPDFQDSPGEGTLGPPDSKDTQDNPQW